MLEFTRTYGIGDVFTSRCKGVSSLLITDIYWTHLLFALDVTIQLVDEGLDDGARHGAVARKVQSSVESWVNGSSPVASAKRAAKLAPSRRYVVTEFRLSMPAGGVAAGSHQGGIGELLGYFEIQRRQGKLVVNYR